MSPSSTALTTPPVSFLQKLLRELRDEIFNYVYCEDNELVSVSRYRDYYNKQRRERTTRAQASPLPETSEEPSPEDVRPFLNMLVSKQFFAEASEAWALKKTIVIGDMTTLKWITPNCLPTTMITLDLDWDKISFEANSALVGLKKYTTLRKLKIWVSYEVFEAMGRLKMPWRDRFTDYDFEKCKTVQILLGMEGLREVEMVSKWCELVDSEEERGAWEGNVAALGDFLRRELVRRREERDAVALRVSDVIASETAQDLDTDSKGEESKVVELPHSCQKLCCRFGNLVIVLAGLVLATLLLALAVVSWMLAKKD